jgi:hypothetical protein
MDNDLPPAPDGIPAADWFATPASVQLLVLALMQQVATLTVLVQELEQRLSQTSQNSSTPPIIRTARRAAAPAEDPARSPAWRAARTPWPDARAPRTRHDRAAAPNHLQAFACVL